MAERRGGGCCPPMDLMRSEPMQLVQLIIPAESAHLTTDYLGELGLVQFEDLNAEKSPFRQTYTTQIRRCLSKQGSKQERLRQETEAAKNRAAEAAALARSHHPHLVGVHRHRQIFAEKIYAVRDPFSLKFIFLFKFIFLSLKQRMIS
ncbi:unnamed protein product [Coffea canephora]|uniref:DH200=94 genomic scaffold, scaffold_899 n=1 Tax=Coffea canephora TaxID=49390 RepID=A0A068VHN0_COFCA|nr:unnamed protein product [Coffea canephora]